MDIFGDGPGCRVGSRDRRKETHLTEGEPGIDLFSMGQEVSRPRAAYSFSGGASHSSFWKQALKNREVLQGSEGRNPEFTSGRPAWPVLTEGSGGVRTSA